MRFLFPRPALILFLGAVLLLLSFVAEVKGQNGILREVYLLGSGSSSLEGLTNNPVFPNTPDIVETIPDYFEGPYNYGERFGDRFRALIIPPQTGTYVFWIAGDDTGLLLLSIDESPLNERRIGINTLTALFRAWYTFPSQQSTNIYMEAGRRYYIEAIHSAGQGDDSLSVGWKLPNGTLEMPIPISRLLIFGLPAVSPPAFTRQPANLTAIENAPATFWVGVSNLDVLTYQWQRNGTNAPGIVGATFALPSVSLNDNGSTFRCTLSNSRGSVSSSTATLTVLPDTTAPTLVAVANLDLNTVEVTFSEPVEASTATSVSNYTIDNGIGVITAKFGSSTRSVQLTTSRLTQNTTYTLSVNNVRDRAAAQNTISPGWQMTFPVFLKGIYREFWADIPGSSISDLTNSPAFPNNPSSVEFMSDFLETPSYPVNHYGQRLRARVIAPATGNYTFWIAAADSATLSLGTDQTPGSARQIASVSLNSQVSPRQWDVQANQRSAPISLVGGQRYYLEVLMKGGISDQFPPDHFAVRWQLPDGSIEEPIPASRLSPFGLVPPAITAQPVSTVVVEGAGATFAVSVSNRDPVSYQWQENGTNLPGATNAILSTAPVRLAEDGSIFQCVLSNVIGTATTVGALLSVTPDVRPPVIANVLTISSNKVVVFFSEPVEPATATNAGNYTISAATVTAAALRDKSSVTLSTSLLLNGADYTLTVSGVRDTAATPNTIVPNSQWNFVAGDFFPQDIGSPPVPGSITFVETGVNVVASGNGSAGTIDQFNFSYQQIRGNFDVKVRVQRLDFADMLTQAGLMVREELGTNSRYAAVFCTPSVAGTFFQYRTTTNASAQTGGAFPANYPSMWLRLQRVETGSRFNGYASYDGQNWTLLGTAFIEMRGIVYLGFAVASHNPSQATLAQFRDFTDTSGELLGVPPTPTEPLGPSSRRTGLVFSEIMYHPAPRADGRKLEFVELYNSNPTPEDLGGYRISGDIDFRFPKGTLLQGGAFLVIARNPGDIQAVYGIPNVTGPYTNSLSNKSGTVRLRNRQDAILLEVNYESKPPWPIAPDGSGHSLVLARPSLGEDHPEAWAQSDAVGGSPGIVDGVGPEPARNVVINEFLAHTLLPEVDYVELYNHGTVPVDLSGFWLSDSPTTNKFRIPDGTMLGPTGFVSFLETTLGFSLSSGGEAIYLVNSNLTRVIDSVLFDAQELGVATGRVPDGGKAFQRLAAKTPGARNGAIRAKNIVINEIMYHPVTEDDNDEFVELYNRTTNAINLINWKFTDGIDFKFTNNTIIQANGYLVIAKNAAHLMANYPQGTLTINNTVGNYSGTLANSGEHLAISMPETILATNDLGVVTTNVNYIAVDEVTYGKGGKWGNWSDGGGSSLELIDPHSDGRLPSNWADSDDTAKSSFTTLSVTGTLDHEEGSASDWNSLQLYLLEPGECLVDKVDVRVPPANLGVNLVTNGDFEISSLQNWFFQGDHRKSFIGTPGDGSSSGHSLHVVASDRGDTGANRIYTLLLNKYGSNIPNSSITARVKWLHGRPEIIFRLRGNGLELAGNMAIPKNLGTPGVRNSRYATNAGPGITEIMHNPVVPAANQPVVVTARIHDPDGVSSVQLIYRVDNSFTPTVTNLMVDNGTGGDAVPGDGIYSATIPGQPNDSLVAFYIRATDAVSPAASTRFPNDAPARECLVRFGDSQPLSSFGTYRFWFTQATHNDWLQHEFASSETYQGTFVYGNFRPVYNAGSHYAGSPAHAKLYNGPMGTNCDYQLLLPEDDALLDETSIRIQEPGLFGADSTCQNEQLGYWLVNQLGLPALNRRSVNLFMNGMKRGLIYEDTQRQNSGFDDEWFPNPNSDFNDLYRIGYWYEFSDDLTHRSDAVPSLLPFTTTGSVKKLPRYRQTFNKRAIKSSAHDYTNLFNLVDVLNTAATGDAYAAQVYPVVDIVSWARAFAAERIINNTDLYGALRLFGPNPKPGAQNSFIFKPAGDSWKFLIWDIDAAFLGLPTDSLFDFTDPPVSNLFAQPLVLRTYWQALEDAAYGPLVPANLYPPMDSKYAAYLGSGIAAASPQKMKDYLGIRRDYILELLTQVRASFGINNNGGTDFTSPNQITTLFGTAPITARRITINGVDYPLSWASITNWAIQLPLMGPTNRFTLQGYDAQGNALSNYSRTITVYYNGPVSRAEDSLVISEIMYRPAVSNASYVEIYNRSANTTFSLLNYQLHGVDFNFSPGMQIGPQSFLVVPKDPDTFKSVYGTSVRLTPAFNGNLDPDGETLSLIKRGLTTNEADVVIDKVKYEAITPWPLRPGATNSGTSLQLIDPAQDNARVSNWDDGNNWRFVSFTGAAGGTRLLFYLDSGSSSSPAEIYLDDIKLVAGAAAGVGSNYVRNGDFETSLSSGWSFLTSSSTPTGLITNSFFHSGSNCLRLTFTKSGSTSICMYQDITSLVSGSTYTLSFWYRPSTNANNLISRVGGSGFQPSLNVRPMFLATPGAMNSVAGTVAPYPLLWINEVQPINATGLQDNTGIRQPWVELFNSGTNDISLDGLSLSKSFTSLNQWTFPNGMLVRTGQYMVVFLDGQTNLSTGTVVHASFRPDPTNGVLVLSRGLQILDYVRYTNMLPDLSYGSWPDGQLFDRQVFYFVTPAAPNNPAPAPVIINEWLASNTRTLQNPANFNRFDDWFELYNFGASSVNLSGYFLTDDLTKKNKWAIPSGTIIGPHAFLLCWADSSLSNTNLAGNALHTSFNLAKGGDEIGLYSATGIKVDTVIFGPQASDITQGRFPDGNFNGPFFSMVLPTPGTNNITTNNFFAPILSPIPNYTVSEGDLLTFTAQATDADLPAQTLTYFLRFGAPAGASITVGGVFSWRPGEVHGGGSYPISVIVSDNSAPPLTGTNSFTVTVLEANTAPAIGAIADRTTDPYVPVSFSIPGIDSDVPAQTLSYALVSGPAGVSVNANGQFTWTPTQSQAPSTNPIIVKVADNGTPSLSATQSFRIFVNPGNPCNGYKGDVRGDGFVSIADWVLVGKLVAHPEAIADDCQFAKVDCSPKASCGNGSITLNDWLQVGLFAAGLDPLVSCGSVAPPEDGPLLSETTDSNTVRTLRIPNLTLARGETACLQILLDAHGDENGLGWSLSFDTNLLTFVSAGLDNYSTNAPFGLLTNLMFLPQGQVGFAFLLPGGDRLPAELQGVVDVCFQAVPGTETVSTLVRIADLPIRRGVADPEGNSLLANTGFTNGTVTVTGNGVSFASIQPLEGGQVKLTITSPPGSVFQLEASSDLLHWEKIGDLTNATGRLEYTVSTNGNPRFYRTKTSE